MRFQSLFGHLLICFCLSMRINFFSIQFPSKTPIGRETLREENSCSTKGWQACRTPSPWSSWRLSVRRTAPSCAPKSQTATDSDTCFGTCCWADCAWTTAWQSFPAWSIGQAILDLLVQRLVERFYFDVRKNKVCVSWKTSCTSCSSRSNSCLSSSSSWGGPTWPVGRSWSCCRRQAWLRAICICHCWSQSWRRV